jgi:hypothetical protein
MLRVCSHWKAVILIQSLKIFQKIQKFIAFTATCLKVQQKAILVAIVVWGLIYESISNVFIMYLRYILMYL